MDALSIAESFNRLAAAMEQIGAALVERNRIERERLDKQFPPERKKRDAEIYEPERERRESLGDKASDEWVRETENAVPSRFQQRYDAQHPEGTPKREPKVRRVEAVPKRDKAQS